MSSNQPSTIPGSQLLSIKNRVIPSSVSQVGTITKYEMLNYFRSRRFFVLLAIDLFISGLLTFLVAYYSIVTARTTVLGFFSFWWNGIYFIIALAGIFFGGDAISGEIQNKTGYFLVAHPLRRSSIYVGKWIGAFIASMIVLGIFVAITVGNSLYYFGDNIPWAVGESFIFSILYLMAVLGLTFFFSSLFRASSMSILVTAILFLFAFSLIQDLVQGLAGIEPWFIITYGAGIILNVLSSPYPTTQRGVGLGGRELQFYAVSIPEGIVIMLCYFVATAILGLVLFERREFT
ncbi:ABC transporter permease subunit [Candidatus Bathyarchaeota archaeon]|nr:ABC transporter permease subunit [Candidatus Bathyarchaeota archaeon]